LNSFRPSCRPSPRYCLLWTALIEDCSGARKFRIGDMAGVKPCLLDGLENGASNVDLARRVEK
ncbi:MAG: hypothetical protein WA213_14595, partial [Terriglobales bacterium]